MSHGTGKLLCQNVRYKIHLPQLYFGGFIQGVIQLKNIKQSIEQHMTSIYPSIHPSIFLSIHPPI